MLDVDVITDQLKEKFWHLPLAVCGYRRLLCSRASM